MKHGGVAGWWRGRLRLQLRGVAVAQVIADLHRQRILLTDIQVGEAAAELTVSLSDFWKCYQTCRRNRVKFRILEREGFPFWRKRAARRKMLLAGSVLFVALLYTFSSFVWQLSVVGASEGTEEMLMDAARDNGLFVGAWRPALPEPQVIQADLLRKVPNLVWVGVQVNGTRATIRAVEKIPGVAESDAVPHHVIAGKPGVILKVLANRGTVMVQPGQVVHPGQVLISGALSDDGKHVPASGQVFAEVWYRTEVHVPLQVRAAALTGASSVRSELVLGPWSLPVWGWQTDKTPTYEQDIVTNWRIGKWILPVQWKRVRLYAVSELTLKQSEDAALQSALALAAQDVQTQSGHMSKLLGQTVLQHHLAHGNLYATVLTRTEEDIGIAAPIPAPVPKQQG